MKLSIIIPMFNAESYLARCLNSIFDQNLSQEEYELIIINDGSTDNSLFIAKNFKSNYSNLKVCTTKNNGLSVARNLGIEMAQGKYIFFVDSDDYITTNSLHVLIEAALDNNLDILSFKFLRTKSSNLNISNELNLEENLEIMDGESYLINNMYYRESVCWYLIKKDFLIKTKLKFIIGRFLQDTIFTAEVFIKAKRVAFIPLEVYRYVINPNSVWTNKELIHTRKKIDDFIFITIKYNDLLNNLDNQKLKKRLEFYRDQMTLNILKRILESDLKFPEIKNKIKSLEVENIYPINQPILNTNFKFKPWFLWQIGQNLTKFLIAIFIKRAVYWKN